MLALTLTGHPYVLVGWMIFELGLKAWQLPRVIHHQRELRRDDGS